MTVDAMTSLLQLPDIEGMPLAALALEHLPVSASIVEAIREDGKIVDFCIKYSNRAASVGQSEEDRTLLYGRALFDVIPDYAESGLLDSFIQAVEQQESFAKDDVALAGEFEGVPYDVVLEVVGMPLGGDYLLSVSHDRTAEHASSARLALARQQLERRNKVEVELRDANKAIVNDLVNVQRALDAGDARTAQHHASKGAERAAEIMLGVRDLLRA